MVLRARVGSQSFGCTPRHVILGGEQRPVSSREACARDSGWKSFEQVFLRPRELLAKPEGDLVKTEY